MRGRKPTPTALKLLRGNPGKRRLSSDEPQLPPPAVEPPPEALAGDAVALAEWARVEPVLRKARILTAGNRAVLVACCFEWSVYLEAKQQLRAKGLVVTSRRRGPRPSPYVGIAHKALIACLRLWSELGMSPAARTRIHVAADGGSATSLDTFLQ